MPKVPVLYGLGPSACHRSVTQLFPGPRLRASWPRHHHTLGDTLRTRTVTAGLLLAGLLLTGCGTSSDSGTDNKPAPAPATVTAAAPEPAPLTEEETIEQCTTAVAEAAPGWDDWNIDLAGWEDDPRTPRVCKTLRAADFLGALTDGLDTAAACGTPEALPGKC